MRTNRRNFSQYASSSVLACLIFFFCIAIYLSNGFLSNSTWDNFPNTILTFNFLEKHTIHLDALRETNWYSSPAFGGAANYSIVESDVGHLTSSYPIGTALLTAPLYSIYYLFIKAWSSLSGAPLNLLSPDFEQYRLVLEKLTSVIVTSASVSTFFLFLRNRFSTIVAAISSFIFAFGTHTWTISSQALWQHTAGNFALIMCAFLLVKSESCTTRKSQSFYLLFAGLFCGLLPAIRPSSLLFFTAFSVFSLLHFRHKSFFFFLGSLSILPAIIWNFYYFTNFISGGYGYLYGKDFLYHSDFIFFIENFLRLSLSPSRGFFVYSPILLVGFLGLSSLWKSRSHGFDRLFICLLFSGVGIFSSFCFYQVWWGGHSFGPRLLTDLLPISCGLVCYGIESSWGYPRSIKLIFSCLFSGLLVSSVFVQAVGIFGNAQGSTWNSTPINVDYCPARVMDWKDQQIQRHRNSIWNSLFLQSHFNQEYFRNLAGKLVSVETYEDCEVDSQRFSLLKHLKQSSDADLDLDSTQFSSFAGETLLLKTTLLNTGKSRWYGYKSALSMGETKVRVSMENNAGDLHEAGQLYLSSSPRRLESTVALGSIRMPHVVGEYKLTMELVSDSKIAFSSSSPLTVSVSVLPKPFPDKEEEDFEPPRYDHQIQLIEGEITELSSGDTQRVELWVKNTSNFDWFQIGRNPVRLSYKWFYSDGRQVILPEVRGELPFHLLSERNATVKLNLTAPNKPGKYRLLFSAVQEDVAWFIDRGATPLAFDVVVVDRLE